MGLTRKASFGPIASMLVSLLTVVAVHVGRNRRWHHLEDAPWVLAAALMWWLIAAFVTLLLLVLIRSVGWHRPGGTSILLGTTIGLSLMLIASDLFDRWMETMSLWT
jgi:hypothetical protein